MDLRYDEIALRRDSHPAWRLLRANQGPLVLSFLYKAFVATNARVIGEDRLAAALDDELYDLRQTHLKENLAADTADEEPKSGREYLEDWARKGWLKRRYRDGSDEIVYDLTSATEKAIDWVMVLAPRSFVGTESRWLTLFGLLREMTEYTNPDVGQRVRDLQAKRDEIDREIEKVLSGQAPMLSEVQLKERWLQFTRLGRELVTDFREVEENFRALDRQTRDRITAFEGSKGKLLEAILGERESISRSDQGQSFRAFFELLMSSTRQDEFLRMLEPLLAHPTIQTLGAGERSGRLLRECLAAATHTQSVIQQLSGQLRRILDAEEVLEGRRIAELTRGIEAQVLALRDRVSELPVELVEIDLPRVDLDLPLERPLYTPTTRTAIIDVAVEAPDEESDLSALFGHVYVDPEEIGQAIEEGLDGQPQVSLATLVRRRPLTRGLAELVTYLDVGSKRFGHLTDETSFDEITWLSPAAEPGQPPIAVTARLHRVIFWKSA